MATLVLPERKIHIDAFGLDVDGVLRDTGYHIYEATLKALKELGANRTPTFEHFVRGQGGDLVTFYKECGVELTKEEIYASYDKYVPSHDAEKPFEDVVGFLLALTTRNVKVFVVSGHPTEKLQRWFEEYNFHEHIHHLQGGSRDKAVHIRAACEHLEVSPRATCYVGDWGNDMKAAVLARTVPIGDTRTYATRKILIEADAQYAVDHLSELVGIIR